MKVSALTPGELSLLVKLFVCIFKTPTVLASKPSLSIVKSLSEILYVSVAGDFNNSGINVNTFNLSLAGDFHQRQYTEIRANTFNLSVAGDFDNIAEYFVSRNGFITNSEGRLYVDALNLNVGGDFTFSESANDFIWRANDTLTVSGSANITAASFNNSGTIDVDNSFNINAASFNNSGFITVTNNSFNAVVDNFSNEAGATIAAFGGCTIVYTTSSDSGTITCQVNIKSFN